ncbi:MULTISPECIES: ribulokinase [Staphylococcus]|jgi:L-ribulokinase|uniref:ribulokinase n=1 Tax=Staphylococcus TaxID=1279 RepID=UPI00057BE879|nr:ribulokinase [Staphylococcus shinii]MBO3065782.1 ribulokinase [Staphylococcus shinii]MEC5301355.1 ribulokinase [Staphylococcus shinii]OEK88077.1 ribulokinase [Staphylococcus shinii]PKI14449.1 ribulokinase [Staphylococcus shinii]PTI02750.1 ribulokinase [Staphylococcus shinii]
MTYSIGVDFGTGSGRAFLINTENGKIEGQYIKNYTHGTIEGTLGGEKLPQSFALQNGNDYMEVIETGIPAILEKTDISPSEIVGIGIDFTSSTVIFVDEQMEPIHNKAGFQDNPHAYVKLWKHHGAQDEADLLFKTALEAKNRWLGYYGFNVSSEWMIPKIMEVNNKAPEVMAVTANIMEAGDWIVNRLTGQNVRSNCGLGFKSFWEEETGFHYDLFDKVDSDLSDIVRTKVDAPVVNIGDSVGTLSKEMADKLGLSQDTQVSPFIIDAHASLLGIGSEKDKEMTMVMGTSTCHLMLNKEQHKVPGISGSVKGAIIPDLYAYEAGQTAVGDLFEYIAKQAPYDYVKVAESRGISIFDLLNEKASKLYPGESGLIALDWHNGNRSVLSDSNLKGSIFGMSLQTKHEEIYRAYLEATAFGAKMIMQQYQGWQMEVDHVFACGGIPKKNGLLMEIYANILNKKITIIDSEYAPAIGAAILGSICGGAHPDFNSAIKAMKEPVLYQVEPDPQQVRIYKKLFSAYKELHDLHGYKKARIMRNVSALM